MIVGVYTNYANAQIRRFDSLVNTDVIGNRALKSAVDAAIAHSM